MLPAVGYVTASANCTAAAASKAFPPAFRMATPTSVASGSGDATIPFGATFGSVRDGTVVKSIAAATVAATATRWRHRANA